MGDLRTAKQKIATRQKIAELTLVGQDLGLMKRREDANPTLGVLLAMRSISRLLDNGATKYTLNDFEDGLEALQQSIQESFLRQRFQEGGRNMLGHVESVAFTPEGKIVRRANTADLGVPTVTIRDPSYRTNSELYKDGSVLIGLRGQRFTLDPDKNRRASSIAVSPDGAYFAIGQDDGKIKALDIRSESQSVVETKAHRHPINLITLSNRRTPHKGPTNPGGECQRFLVFIRN